MRKVRANNKQYKRFTSEEASLDRIRELALRNLKKSGRLSRKARRG